MDHHGAGRRRHAAKRNSERTLARQNFGDDGAAAGPWQEAGIFPSTRNVLITGLTPGVIYNVRVRAIGGSTQYSEWSAPMPMMAN